MVAVLNYANKEVLVILGLTAMVFCTVVLPHFFRTVDNGDLAVVRSKFRRYSKIIILISVSLTIVLIIYSESITRLLYERGGGYWWKIKRVKWVILSFVIIRLY